VAGTLLTNTITGPVSTLVLLVTCSRDESRRDLAVTVTKNLAKLIPQAGLDKSFVIFDNASTLQDHLAYVPTGAIVCWADRNIGYWSAIKWVLEKRSTLFDRRFKYLYIVESDHYHRDLALLAECEAFLDAEPRASGVRTQEFSVRWRWRYNKRLRGLPFYNSRSAVQMHNAVTGEPAWFRKVPQRTHIYLSNLHTRLPELNRLAALDRTFEQLSAMTKFTETDYFRLMMEDHPLVGVYDGGLYYPLSTPLTPQIISGSFSKVEKLRSIGYETTRTDRIDTTPFNVAVTRVQKE